MDEQITQLDKRLATVEHTVASLSAEVEFSRVHFATKEDIAKLDTKISVIQSNYATKEALAAVENKLSGQIAALDAKLTGQNTELDTKLTGQMSALELKFAQLEIKLMRWSIGMVIGFAGVVAGLLKLMT